MMTPSRPALLGGAAAFPDGLPLVRPRIADVPNLLKRLDAVLTSGLLTNNRTVRELEARAAERLGVPHVVAVSSCTAGLMLVLQALGARGRVVMPSFTFSASAHAVIWAGGTPVFADVDPGSLTLDPIDAEAALGDGAVAMTATHIYGTPCDVEALAKVADAASVPIVYDAAHAFGSVRAGTPIGGFGAAEVFSLSPTKVLVAGEGGLVATNRDDIAAACRLGRDYGNPGNYDCAFPGLNARMSELHAAVALASLEGLDERIAHRGDLVATFRRGVASLPGLGYPVLADDDLTTYKDLTIIVKPEEFGLTVPELRRALEAEGIDSRRYYHPPIHRQQAYAGLGPSRALPVTDDIAERVITPPLWSHMTHDQVAGIAAAFGRIYSAAAEIRSVLA